MSISVFPISVFGPAGCNDEASLRANCEYSGDVLYMRDGLMYKTLSVI